MKESERSVTNEAQACATAMASALGHGCKQPNWPSLFGNEFLPRLSRCTILSRLTLAVYNLGVK